MNQPYPENLNQGNSENPTQSNPQHTPSETRVPRRPLRERIPWSRVVPWTIILALILVVWFLRPLGIIHGPLMFFYKYPLTWMAPLLTVVVVIGVTAIVVWRRGKRQSKPGYPYRHRRGPWEVATIVALFLAPTAFFLALIISPILTGQAIYNHYGPFEKTELPESAETRIMPKTVANTLARNGFASPTETLENNHIIQTDKGLRWTFGQSPDGVFRRITKKTKGSASLDANTTSRKLRFYDGTFKIAPGHVWADGITWKAYKKHFFSEVSESIYLPGKGGGRILVPYIKYEGFLVKVPVLGGAYLVSPDGSIEDLSPEEARENPYVQDAGRLFPSELARRVQDSFVYVQGILNRIFAHRDVLTVEDRLAGDKNRQPHFLSVDDSGQWISVAEPWGRADAIGGIFLTDAISGKTRLWRASKSAGLTSSRRAQDATEALAIPGVSFRGGDFRAIEPRPVFRDGKLFFLVSIIPKSASTISKSVIIEPRSNKAVAIFSHTDDPSADQKLLDYLAGERVGEEISEEAIGSESNRGDIPGSSIPGSSIPGSGIPGSGGNLSASERALLRDLLRQNERQRQALLDLLNQG